MSYAVTRKDFEYLETIAELDDWVTIMDEVENFMRKPNKEFASGLYETAISKWFDEHGYVEDKLARRIARKYHHFCARA